MKSLKNQHYPDHDVAKMLSLSVVIFIVMTMLNSNFIKVNNLTSMGYQMPELGLYSLAMMITMLSGGIDLSVVAIGNLSAICAVTIMHSAAAQSIASRQAALYIGGAVVLALCVGAFFGALNGYVVAYLHIAPMLATMASSMIIGGLSLILTQGKSISKTFPSFTYFGSHTLFGVPYTMLVLLLLFLFTGFLLHRTKFGFEVKMVGTNPKASHYAGINEKWVYIKSYLYSGLISALCGLIILARTDAAKADYAMTYVLQSILCCVLGATDPDGGTAKPSCLLLALLSLQFLSSSFNMLHLNSYFKEFAWGLLLIAVLSINSLSNYLRQRHGQHRAADKAAITGK